MSRLLFLFALALSCVACSNEFQVLEERPDGPDAPGSNDGGMRDATLRDASSDARAMDASQPPLDAAWPIPSDGSVRDYAVSGFAQTCALVGGQLHCWGADNLGQVGVPGTSSVLRPVKLNGDRYTDVCAGELHTCALREDGTLQCWGNNTFGELGLGDLDPRELPTALEGREFLAVSCGGNNTCALSARGELWCWGSNEDGKLGQNDPAKGEPGSIPYSAVPVQVQTALRFAKVHVGQGHVCALDEQGRSHCWGRNNHDQLGLGAGEPQQTRAPRPVSGDARYRTISAGQHHTCAVDMAGRLWCWGETKGGLLGIRSDQATLPVPTRVEGDDYASVSVNWLHSCALKQDGVLLCWGRGIEGQLGNGSTGPRELPTPVFGDLRFRAANAGQFHSCGFTDDALYCWGANDTGQLGVGDLDRHYVPDRVAF